jgi:TPR repeat protein
MSTPGFKKRVTVVAVGLILLTACVPQQSPEQIAKATEGYIEDTNKLFVVDCLLPGQVRKLGAQMTYLSARRPIRTTAGDCEVRGGEYVAYDRANYASAFKVWLPKAQEGDAEAQNIVGQVFEKGLGMSVDYKSALQWYTKAAEQGNSQAQLNLGHLYEKGLGTAPDQQTAEKWYRKASGLDAVGLNFTPAVTSNSASLSSDQTAELAALRQEVQTSRQAAEKSRQEADALRTQLLVAQDQVMAQQASLRQSQDDMEATRQKIQQEKAAAKGDDTALRQLEAELKQKEEQLKTQQARLTEMTGNLNETDKLRREAELSRQEASTLRGQLAESQRQAAAQQAALQQTQAELEQTRLKIQQEKASVAKTDDTALRQLEAELQQKETLLQSQQAQLAALSGSAGEADKLREEASALRNQLAETQQRVAEQQSALAKTRDDLADTQRRIQQEKAAPAKTDDTALRQLEDELRQKQAQLKAQQAQMASMTASLNQERQALKSERAAVHKQAAAPAPVAKVENSERSELTRTQNALNDKINAYQQKSAELTSWLTGGTVERTKIDQRKLELQADSREINNLRERVGQQNQVLAERSTAPLMVAAGPNIEIIEPQVTLTRGMPVIQVNRDSKLKEIVGKISAADGINSLLVNNQPQKVDASGIFHAPLDGSQTQVSIVATDKKNRRANMSVSLLSGDNNAAPTDFAEPTKPSSGSRPGDVNFGQFYALIIGNADYKTYPALKTPVSDAKSVEVLLRERYGFKTKLLLNANRHQIMTALNEMNKRLSDKDNLLIYYAGHGEIDKATQTAYWLPTDAESGNTANWISSQSITEYLSIMPARHVMVVADSCYSGALTGSAVAKLPDGMDESKREKWLKVMNARKARTVLTSGGVKPVLDAGGGDHSIFASAFLKVLRSNNKPVMEDYDLFREVSGQVRGAAAKVGFQQSPQYAPLQHAGHEGSPFFFVPEA